MIGIVPPGVGIGVAVGVGVGMAEAAQAAAPANVYVPGKVSSVPRLSPVPSAPTSMLVAPFTPSSDLPAERSTCGPVSDAFVADGTGATGFFSLSSFSVIVIVPLAASRLPASALPTDRFVGFAPDASRKP